MKYPAMGEVEAAGRVVSVAQISPRVRLTELGGFTSEISKRIGWSPQ